MQNVTLFCFWASYTVAFALEVTRGRWDRPWSRWAGWGMTLAGFVAHTTYLFVRANRSDLPPLLASPHDWLLVLAWVTVLALLVASRLMSDAALGVYLLPPVVAIVSASSFVRAEPSDALLGDERSLYWWGMTHAGLLVLGMAGILMGFVASLMYLAQHRRLKKKAFGTGGARLLDLETLARWNWWLIVVGVPLLTMGIATGVVLSLASYKTGEPVPLWQGSFVVLGVLSAGLVALLIWLIRSPKAGGIAVAQRTAWACGFLLASFLALTLVSPEGGLHGDRGAEVSPPGIEIGADGTETEGHRGMRSARTSVGRIEERTTRAQTPPAPVHAEDPA